MLFSRTLFVLGESRGESTVFQKNLILVVVNNSQVWYINTPIHPTSPL